MSPIEAHLATSVASDLAALGVPDARVAVISGQADDWCYRIVVQNREFVVGFDHHQQLWGHESTAGAVKHLVSNDARPIGASVQARQRALELVALAIAHPDWSPRDPPVI